MRGHVVLVLDFGPADALGGEEVVAALAFLHGADALAPVVAEEAVQDAFAVEAGDDEAADEGDEGDEGGVGFGLVGALAVMLSTVGHAVNPLAGPWWRLSLSVHDRMVCPLEGEKDINQCCDGLDARIVLSNVDEIELTVFICGVPFENVELRVAGHTRVGFIRRAGTGEGMITRRSWEIAVGVASREIRHITSGRG